VSIFYQLCFWGVHTQLRIFFAVPDPRKCMMSFVNLFSKPHEYRKLVDLIYMETHGLFLNLEPRVPIQVGFYG